MNEKFTQTQRHEFPPSDSPQDAICPHCGAPGDTETEFCAEYLEQLMQRQASRPE